ncbi:hypothetical protein KJ966_19520 [bacterium]|nr:hypothetical protein [bacterium]
MCQHYNYDFFHAPRGVEEYTAIDMDLIKKILFNLSNTIRKTNFKGTIMSGQFRLQCEYIHCFGKRIIEVGVANSEEEARIWQQKQTGKRASLTEDDPIKSCPVVRCPLKLQIPRYVFLEVE